MSGERRRRLLHGSLPRLVLLVGLGAAALGALRLLHPVSGQRPRAVRAKSFPVARPSSPIHPAEPAPDAARSRSTTTPRSGEPRRGGADALARASRLGAVFVRVWGRPDLPQARWLAALQPLVTPELAERLATDEPWAVPVHRVVGLPHGQLVGGGAVVSVPTDAGEVVIGLVAHGTGWEVDDVEAGP